MSFASSTKNSALLISEKIIVLGLSFFNSVLLARYAGPEIFGQFNYILSFATLFLPFSAMGLNHVASKYFIKYPNNSHHYFISALLIRALGSLLSIICCLIVSQFLTISDKDLALVFILLVFQCCSIFNLIEYFFLAKNKVFNTIKIRLFAYIFTGIIKALIIINNADILWLILAHALEFLLIGMSYTFIYLHGKHHLKQKRPISIKTFYSFFHKGKWLLLSTLSAIIYLKIDQIMLANMVNTKEVAFYAAAVKLSEFWYVFPVLIANAFNKQLVQQHSKSKNDYQQSIDRLLTLLVIASVVISCLTFFIAPYLVTFIYGDEYNKSASILIVHIFATLFIFQRAIYSKWLIIEKLYRFSLLSQGLGAVINVLLNLWLIPIYGGLGAAWASLFSYMAASYLSLFLSKKTLPFAISMSKAMLFWPYFIYQQTLRMKTL